MDIATSTHPASPGQIVKPACSPPKRSRLTPKPSQPSMPVKHAGSEIVVRPPRSQVHAAAQLLFPAGASVQDRASFLVAGARPAADFRQRPVTAPADIVLVETAVANAWRGDAAVLVVFRTHDGNSYCTFPSTIFTTPLFARCSISSSSC